MLKWPIKKMKNNITNTLCSSVVTSRNFDFFSFLFIFLSFFLFFLWIIQSQAAFVNCLYIARVTILHSKTQIKFPLLQWAWACVPHSEIEKSFPGKLSNETSLIDLHSFVGIKIKRFLVRGQQPAEGFESAIHSLKFRKLSKSWKDLDSHLNFLNYHGTY